MRGLVINCPSKEAREDFLKEFLLVSKKCKPYEKAFEFKDDGDCIQMILLSDEVKGAFSCAMIMVEARTKLKISGIGLCRMDPVELPNGTTVTLDTNI